MGATEPAHSESLQVVAVRPLASEAVSSPTLVAGEGRTKLSPTFPVASLGLGGFQENSIGCEPGPGA